MKGHFSLLGEGNALFLSGNVEPVTADQNAGQCLRDKKNENKTETAAI